MFGISDRHQRRMVKLGDERWVICCTCWSLDAPPGPFSETHMKTPRLALAVRCNARGEVALPALAHLIRFVDADMVNPETEDSQTDL